MGDGLVLEHGTHNELLAKDGAYAHLVQAQKLREADEMIDGDESDEDGEKDGVAALAREEIPLGRRNTGRSLASEIIEQRRIAKGDEEEVRDLTVFGLFRRMAPLVPDQYKNYVLASIFACRTWFSVLFLVPN